MQSGMEKSDRRKDSNLSGKKGAQDTAQLCFGEVKLNNGTWPLPPLHPKKRQGAQVKQKTQTSKTIAARLDRSPVEEGNVTSASGNRTKEEGKEGKRREVCGGGGGGVTHR